MLKPNARMCPSRCLWCFWSYRGFTWAQPHIICLTVSEASAQGWTAVRSWLGGQ